MTGQDGLARKLAELRDTYRTKLPTEADGLKTLAEALFAGGGRDALQALKDRAHRVAGTSGTFGFSAVSDAARALENACGATLAGDASSDALEPLTEAFLAALADSQDEPG